MVNAASVAWGEIQEQGISRADLKSDYYDANRLKLRSEVTIIAAYLDYIKEHQSITDEIEKNKFTNKVELFYENIQVNGHM